MLQSRLSITRLLHHRWVIKTKSTLKIQCCLANIKKTHQDFLHMKQEHSKLRTECDVLGSNAKTLERRAVEGADFLQKIESENAQLRSEVDVLHAVLDTTRADLNRSSLTAESWRQLKTLLRALPTMKVCK